LNTKSPENATKEELVAKVREAAKYVDINQLCISGQCGFASSQHGNVIAQEDQDKKIKLLMEVAKELWNDA
jgi:5-methyltetrahydropteroyltriglutamate--homocysteine methyltransferase